MRLHLDLRDRFKRRGLKVVECTDLEALQFLIAHHESACSAIRRLYEYLESKALSARCLSRCGGAAKYRERPRRSLRWSAPRYGPLHRQSRSHPWAD
jgi:hypothetical protein